MIGRRLVAALALLACAAGCGPDVAGADLIEIKREVLVIAVEVTGELAAVDSTNVMPPGLPDVWEYKIANLAEEGEEVAAGAPVVGFDASELERELDNMRNEADAALKKLEKRQVDAQLARRDEELRLQEAEAALRKATLKTGAEADRTAAIELRLVEADRKLAEMALERARGRAAQVQRTDASELASLADERAYAAGRVAIIEKNIARMMIVAPRAGTVVYPTGWGGEKKKVGDGVWRMQAVLQIVSLDKMVGRGQIDEVDLARVADGQPVNLRLDALPDVQLHGKVTSIGKNVEAHSKNDPSKVAKVELALDGKGDHPLRPGMRFRGEVETERHPDLLVIPVGAVFVTPDGPVAYRLDGDQLAPVRLELGRRNRTSVEVVRGLAAGDRVSRVDPARSPR